MALQQLVPVVIAAVILFIVAGLGVYILNQFATASNSTIVQTLGDKLGSWATTWFPILLIVVIAVVVISMVIGLQSVGATRGRKK